MKSRILPKEWYIAFLSLMHLRLTMVTPWLCRLLWLAATLESNIARNQFFGKMEGQAASGKTRGHLCLKASANAVLRRRTHLGPGICILGCAIVKLHRINVVWSTLPLCHWSPYEWIDDHPSKNIQGTDLSWEEFDSYGLRSFKFLDRLAEGFQGAVGWSLGVSWNWGTPKALNHPI